MVLPKKRKRTHSAAAAAALSPRELKKARTEEATAAPSATVASEIEQNGADEKPFRLLDLPPELRNAIYEKVLEDYVGLSAAAGCVYACTPNQTRTDLSSLSACTAMA